MPDQTFTIKRIKTTNAAYAQKISVLWPLTKRRSLHAQDVAKDMLLVLTWWRKRAKMLKDKKWPDLMGPGKLQFARNCPPAGAVTETDKACRPCRLGHICPWCHMRQTEVLFNKLAAYLPNRGQLPESRKLRLVEISNKKYMSREDASKYVGSQLLEWQRVPKRLLTKWKPLGAYVRIILEPHAVDGQYAGWRFSYRILALIPASTEVPKWIDNGNRHIRVTDVRSKKQLVNVVGRTCRYPTGMFRADPEAVMISLNARRGKRLNEFVGCLRSQKGQNDNNDKHREEAGNKVAA